MKTNKESQIELLKEWNELLINMLFKNGWTFTRSGVYRYYKNPKEAPNTWQIAIFDMPNENLSFKALKDCLKNYVNANKLMVEYGLVAPLNALNKPIVWAMFSNSEDIRIPFIFAYNGDVLVSREYYIFQAVQSLHASNFIATELIKKKLD